MKWFLWMNIVAVGGGGNSDRNKWARTWWRKHYFKMREHKQKHTDTSIVKTICEICTIVHIDLWAWGMTVWRPAWVEKNYESKIESIKKQRFVLIWSHLINKNNKNDNRHVCRIAVEAMICVDNSFWVMWVDISTICIDSLVNYIAARFR